jgi:hypothetical protein
MAILRSNLRGIPRVWALLVVTATMSVSAVAIGSAGAVTTGGAIHIVSVGSASMPQNDVVITGAFADAGTFSVGKNPIVPMKLSKGTLKVSFAKGGAAENAVFANMSKYLNPTTCAFVASFTSTYPIVGGTGSYAGAHGSVSLVSSLNGVFPRSANGKCNLGSNASPIGFLNTATGSGTISFS